MIISHGTRALFIHIQKTAGSSIEEALRSADTGIAGNIYDGKRHIRARDFRSMVASEIWDSYFKFAFVRNPWDRLVSWYAMCIENPSNDFTRHIKRNAPTFSDFIKKTTHGIAEKTTWNQADYITDEQGLLLVDFVGRYENMREDYACLARKLNLRLELTHVNSSKHGNYRRYYTAETREIVRRRFHKDIQAFGYEF